MYPDPEPIDVAEMDCPVCDIQTDSGTECSAGEVKE